MIVVVYLGNLPQRGTKDVKLNNYFLRVLRFFVASN